MTVQSVELQKGIRKTRDRKAFEILSYSFITLVTVLCLLPFWLVVVGSFTSEAEIYQHGYSLWPQEFSLEAYNTAFKYPEKVIRAYGITVSITVLGTFLSLLFTSMCGYALQREDERLGTGAVWRNAGLCQIAYVLCHDAGDLWPIGPTGCLLECAQGNVGK